jgi:hypothetical protein
MKASNMDNDGAPTTEAPAARVWLGVVGAAVAIVLLCALWTFWA